MYSALWGAVSSLAPSPGVGIKGHVSFRFLVQAQVTVGSSLYLESRMLLLPLNPLLLRNQAPSFTQSWSPLQSSKNSVLETGLQILCPRTLGLCHSTASSQVPKTDGGQLLAQKYRGNLASAPFPTWRA